MIRVLIVGNVRLYREALAEVLARQSRIAVLGAIAARELTANIAGQLRPDVILLDGTGSDGPSEVRSIVQLWPPARIIALGVPDSPAEVLGFAEAGIVGYLPLGARTDQLLTTMELVSHGEFQVSPRVAALLLRRVGQLASSRAGGGPQGIGAAHRLTPREIEVIRLVDRGFTNKEIALRLGIEVSTAKNHVHNILEKLQVKHRGQAAARVRADLPRWGRRHQAAPVSAARPSPPAIRRSSHLWPQGGGSI